MMVDARGKLGGQVFSKSRQGSTIRTKVTPANPQSSRQGSVRSIFSSLSKGWNTITESQRESWNSASQIFKRTNVFGDQVALSGKNLFISVNTNLSTVGASPIDVAPTTTDVASITDLSVAVSTIDNTIDLGYTLDVTPSANMIIVVESTRQNSAGRFNFSGQFRQLAVTPSTVPLVPADLYEAYEARFGTIEVGSKIAFRVYVVSKINGFTSPKAVVSAIVK